MFEHPNGPGVKVWGVLGLSIALSNAILSTAVLQGAQPDEAHCGGGSISTVERNGPSCWVLLGAQIWGCLGCGGAGRAATWEMPTRWELIAFCLQ